MYRDYAQEEDPTEKILNAHAGHYSISSFIPHEDETASNLASQKLPSKLGAMLTDPGEFLIEVKALVSFSVDSVHVLLLPFSLPF